MPSEIKTQLVLHQSISDRKGFSLCALQYRMSTLDLSSCISVFVLGGETEVNSK